jgi:hypothetical protein
LEGRGEADVVTTTSGLQQMELYQLPITTSTTPVSLVFVTATSEGPGTPTASLIVTDIEWNNNSDSTSPPEIPLVSNPQNGTHSHIYSRHEPLALPVPEEEPAKRPIELHHEDQSILSQTASAESALTTTPVSSQRHSPRQRKPSAKVMESVPSSPSRLLSSVQVTTTTTLSSTVVLEVEVSSSPVTKSVSTTNDMDKPHSTGA